MTANPEYAITVVRVFVHEWPEAVDFYSEKVGLRLVNRHEDFGWAEFDVGGCRLAIERLARDDEEAADLVGRYVGITLHVADIGAAHRALVERGVEFVSPPQQQNWGGLLAHFRDLEGNVVTLVGNPPDGSRTN